ncbi:MAG: phosphoglycerate kinase [Rhodothermales bacterium]|nr:phosphoglycerate kinase [Rhodothermales bacterium]
MAKLKLDGLDVKGKRVLVRVDFNVPLKDGAVSDDTRIRAALPTIHTVLDRGGTAVLMSHLGRPKGVADPKYSLAPVARHLQSITGKTVTFSTETVGDAAMDAVSNAPTSSIVLLENTRFHPGETKNDPDLARSIAALGDVFVNDAFGSAHRAHASTEGVTHFVSKSAMGFLLEKEIKYLSALLAQPKTPFVAVLGGAKVSDKIGVIENLLPLVDKLLIGGAMSYTFLKAQGHGIGNSLVEEDKLDVARELLERAPSKILIPTDHVAATTFDNVAEHTTVRGEIPAGYMGLDIGAETVSTYEAEIGRARTVVWNGPMGVFEMSNFAAGTNAVARAMAEVTHSGALTVVGGGDSVAAITQGGYDDHVSHVSTGGGAMLEFLEGKVLPGVASLTDS